MQPPSGLGRILEFNSDFSVRDPEGLIIRWAITYEPKKNTGSLWLYTEDMAFATLYLEKSGVWKGRERGSNGFITLVSTGSRNDLSKVRDLNSFEREFGPKPEKNDFVYSERLMPQIAWEDQDYNLVDSLKSWEPVDYAIAIACCDRPRYLEAFAESLSKNEGVNDYPIFAFMDLPPEKKNIGVVDEQVGILRKYFPKVTLVKRRTNFGCGRNIIDLRKQMFDSLQCKNVFVFEDDMEVSKNYLKYCRQLQDWSSQFSNVGIVQGWNHCVLPNSEKILKKSEVSATMSNLWGYLQSKHCWDSISPLIYEYQKLFLGALRYSDRPHKSIMKWFRDKAEDRKFFPSNTFPEDSTYILQRKNYFDAPPTGQDALTNLALYAKGWVRLAPVVNRGHYIGKLGIHMSPQRFIQNQFDQMSLLEFFDEAKNFTLRGVSSDKDEVKGKKFVTEDGHELDLLELE